MPPALNQKQTVDTGHMLPARRERSGLGSVVGIVIILILLAFGGLYFWGAYLNRKNSLESVPFIPADDSTQQVG